MQRSGFLGKENKPDRRSCVFKKLTSSLLIFFDEYSKISK